MDLGTKRLLVNFLKGNSVTPHNVFEIGGSPSLVRERVEKLRENGWPVEEEKRSAGKAYWIEREFLKKVGSVPNI